jgi:hypothetical protein
MIWSVMTRSPIENPSTSEPSSTIPLAEFEHGLHLMETGENGSIKAVLKP